MTLTSAISSLEVEDKILAHLHVEEESFTLIHCSYWSSFEYANGGWVQLWNTTCLQKKHSDEKLPLLHAIAVPIAPQKHWFKKPGEFLPFTLIFGKIPVGWKCFDLIEPVPNGFKVFDIKKNAVGIYRVTIS